MLLFATENGMQVAENIESRRRGYCKGQLCDEIERSNLLAEKFRCQLAFLDLHFPQASTTPKSLDVSRLSPCDKRSGHKPCERLRIRSEWNF